MSDAEIAAEALKLLVDVETATIGHIRSEGFTVPEIQCLTEGIRIAGTALTVSMPGDDGTALVRALSAARPGDILVIARPGDDRHACWGAVTTAAARAAGVIGVVLDGYVTDLAAIRASGLPVWCRGRSPVTTKNRGGGTVGREINCGGAVVRSGDLVLADENGVYAAAPTAALAAAREALAIQAAEPAIIARLLAGENMAVVYGLVSPA